MTKVELYDPSYVMRAPMMAPLQPCDLSPLVHYVLAQAERRPGFRL